MRTGGSPDGAGRQAAFTGLAGFCTFVGILLLLEIESGWDDIRYHLLSAIAPIALSALVFASYRRLRRARPAEPAELQGLERAVAIAETANLAKSRYLANVSHEIRSPLNAIYGYAQLVERDGAIAGEAARVIRRCTEHLTSLVEGLLDISQVEHGVLRVRAEPVRLGAFIDQIVSMMRPSAAAKGLAFVYEPPPRLPELVRMDQNRVRQVLINLLSNAIKFTDAGQVTLRVGYAGQIATFEIVDTGPGIGADDRERIFGAFERGGDADEQGHPGAGLGLAISKAIVEILGGKLELEGRPGAGACFRVVLMLGEVTGTLLPEARKARVAGYDGGRRSIIVVDDDAEQRAFLEHLLDSLDFAVLAVPTGESALTLCAERHFDLAILDITLPGISGWETAARLRERQGEDIRILMLSANAHEARRPAVSDPAHDDFLVKPFEFEALARAIGGLLNLSWTSDAADKSAVPARPARPAARCDQPLPEAALGHVGRIRELLRIGYVRGIEAEIRQLAEGAPEAADLATQLYGCLDRFDLAGMERTLEHI